VDRPSAGRGQTLTGSRPRTRFGPRVPISKADANLLRNFATALTTAMQHAGVRRAVIVSTAFMFKDPEQNVSSFGYRCATRLFPKFA
jgi:hypothetical protein